MNLIEEMPDPEEDPEEDSGKGKVDDNLFKNTLFENETFRKSFSEMISRRLFDELPKWTTKWNQSEGNDMGLSRNEYYFPVKKENNENLDKYERVDKIASEIRRKRNNARMSYLAAKAGVFFGFTLN